MKCPNCGKPMENGFVTFYGSGFLSRPRWHGEEGSELLIEAHNWLLKGYDFSGFRCKNCKTLVIDYDYRG